MFGGFVFGVFVVLAFVLVLFERLSIWGSSFEPD